MVRQTNSGDIFIKKGNQNIKDHHSVFADSTFFKVFTAPMIAGDPETALNEPNSIVIDETTAKKYFNSTDVAGKTLFVNNTVTCKVTGVIKDFPRQSHFHFSFIRPMRDSYMGEENFWLSNNSQVYVLVKPGITQAFLQKSVDAVIDKYLVKQLEQVVHTSASEMKQRGAHFLYHTMPLKDIHLRSDKSDESGNE